jgi:hypothetical protein
MLILAAPLLLIAAIVGLNTPPPHLNSPMELAAWSKCKLPKIAEYLGQGVDYRLQGKDWQTAEAVMAQGWGDCKGKALIARDTLLACGYDTARIATITTGVPGTIGYQRHAIVLFTDPKTGRRGYIDAEYVRTVDPSTSWKDLVESDSRWRPKGWELQEN